MSGGRAAGRVVAIGRVAGASRIIGQQAGVCLKPVECGFDSGISGVGCSLFEGKVAGDDIGEVGRADQRNTAERHHDEDDQRDDQDNPSLSLCRGCKLVCR